MCLGSIFCNKKAKNDDLSSNNNILFGKLSCNGVKVPLRYGEIDRNCVPLRLVMMTQAEYIKQCGITSADELTDELLLHYFIGRNGGLVNWASASLVKRGRAFGCDIDRAKAFAMLRQAFVEDKVLEIHYIENEGVILNDKSIGGGYFEMELREKYDFERNEKYKTDKG